MICPGNRYFLIVCLLVVIFSQGVSASDQTGIRNIILIIGDGMGPQQIGLLNSYVKYAPNSIYSDRDRQSAIEKAMDKGTIGLAYHEPADSLVTDSAASSSQIASGVMSGAEMIGADRFGNPVETIVEKAERLGKSTGLVSDTRITHATPAGFAAHQAHRSYENEIAVDLLKNDVDVLLSGGLRHWIPKAAGNKASPLYKKLYEMTEGKVYIRSKRKDDRNLLEEATVKGYQLAFTRKQMDRATGSKLLGLFSYSAMPDGIEEGREENNPLRTIPTLREMTAKAIELLSRNEKGFFLMVEAGQIDWAGHNNDAGDLLHEMIRLDKTIEYVLEWSAHRDDTLVIVTADHETAGFSFSYSRKDVPKEKPLEGKLFRNTSFRPYFNYGQYTVLDKLFNQKMSYFSLFRMFDYLPKSERTPGKLAEIVNANTDFPITVQEATIILEREDNQYYIEDHRYMGSKTFPRINDFKEFYVYGNALRCNILARIVAREQMTVWSSGTHTNTPVPIITCGPEQVRARFSGLFHTTEWSRLMQDVLVGKD